MSNDSFLAAADGYVASVKATRGTLPRGYPWVVLAWYAIAAVFVANLERHYPLTAIGLGIGVLASGGLFTWLLCNAKAPVFRVRSEGIQLGRPRHSVTLPWEEIQEIRISPGSDGTVTDILLLPSAHAPRRFSPAAEVILTVIPVSFLFLKAPMLTLLTDPVRYSVPLWGTMADEVAQRLQALAPGSVPITR